MPLDEEVELVAYLHELLRAEFPSAKIVVLESSDPNDSPVLFIVYNETIYAIAVEEYNKREGG